MFVFDPILSRREYLLDPRLLSSQLELVTTDRISRCGGAERRGGGAGRRGA